MVPTTLPLLLGWIEAQKSHFPLNQDDFKAGFPLFPLVPGGIQGRKWQKLKQKRGILGFPPHFLLDFALWSRGCWGVGPMG